MQTDNPTHQLRQAIWEQRASNGMETMREYAKVNLDDLKERLCGCAPEELGDLQGQVKAYNDILKALTQAPVNIE